MAETTTITIRVPVAVKERLDRLAELTRRSRSFLSAEALEIYTRSELEIVEQISAGVEDMEAGRVVPHEEAMAELRERVARVAARNARRSA
jgi:predicted transcriptional regulator